MSEYWKSTPKYWCKHCKTYVRDTKLEKTSHDATPKHQGNLKRFLRDLHRGHERDERDRQRAKDEVEGLNGVVSGSSGSAAEGSTSEGAPWRRKAANPPPQSAQSRQTTPAERKQQMAQLAAMGVAVPEDFRRELALAGDWQTLSERPVNSKALKKEEDDDDVKPSNLNIGVRKRKFEGEEEEEEAGESVLRRGWGSTKRTFSCDGEDDLDTLLERTRVVRRRDEALRDAGSGDAKETSLDLPERRIASTEGMKESPKGSTIKEEESMGFSLDLAAAPEHGLIDAPVFKTEDDSVGSGVVFKKRKPKHLRQK
ncbi:Zinc finger, U1-type [Lasallia pustulata]|uniref:Zinc finger, U1-type n=1 Tax=Lasallia pustulata TaxID=136370 RepID=A0A1W5CRU6_9LECA|nr:Zinc finger, U1-type [Lasallia pustulata]